mmetsp:Transcript_97570/g.172752  ORF Transcript_97570/g.172752 Transcript_97570/m.172752 type:complete len:168 (+) Transcript_97570:61-564(+)
MVSHRVLGVICLVQSLIGVLGIVLFFIRPNACTAQVDQRTFTWWKSTKIVGCMTGIMLPQATYQSLRQRRPLQVGLLRTATFLSAIFWSLHMPIIWGDSADLLVLERVPDQVLYGLAAFGVFSHILSWTVVPPPGLPPVAKVGGTVQLRGHPEGGAQKSESTKLKDN